MRLATLSIKRADVWRFHAAHPTTIPLEPQLATERPLQEGHEPMPVSHPWKSADVQWPDVPLLGIQQDVWYASVRSLGGRVCTTRFDGLIE